MAEKREQEPLKGVFPNPKKIKCKDCVFRDKGQMELGGKAIEYGVTKDQCEIFQKPNYKYHEILFQNANCEFYVKDNKKK